MVKMIADAISYAYRSRSKNVKPKNRKGVNHESFSSRKNLDYHETNSKKNTVRAYRWIINKFCHDFGEEELTELSSEKILQFLNTVTEGCIPQTKRMRFSHLSSFFNFLKNNLDSNLQNPCDLPMLRKLFRPKVTVSWNIIEKETVDEIIFITTKIRNRLILELMARGGSPTFSNVFSWYPPVPAASTKPYQKRG